MSENLNIIKQYNDTTKQWEGSGVEYIANDDGSNKFTPDQIKVIDGKISDLSTDLGAHKADYEYQNSTVVGRQIRVTKQSSTNIVKFKLNTDIVVGVGITISSNNGSTAKPLVDFEGAAITELEKGFVEVVENSINFTLAPKGADLKFFQGMVGESAIIGVLVMVQDNDYIYCNNSSNAVLKIRKSDFSQDATSISYGGTIKAIVQDSEFIYVGGSTTQTIRKIRKSDMVQVAESTNYGGIINAIVEDNDFIYFGGATVNRVWKVRKSTLSMVSQAAVQGIIYSLAQDDSFIYSGSNALNVWKINKSNMVLAAESSGSFSSIQSLELDSEYVYFGTASGYCMKIRKLDMVQVAQSANYGGSIYSIVYDDEFIYFGGYSVIGQALTNRGGIWKVRKSDMVRISRSFNFGSSINAILLDGSFLYHSGVKIVKLTKDLIDHYKYKGLMLIKWEA